MTTKTKKKTNSIDPQNTPKAIEFRAAEQVAKELVDKMVKNRKINYVYFSALSLERGKELISKIYSAPGKTVVYQGYNLTVPIRLQCLRVERCACCGKTVDSYAIVQELIKVAMEYETYRLVPVIDGQMANCDHLVPQALGGRKKSVHNYRATCWACNTEKAHMMDEQDFKAVRGRWAKLMNLQEFKAIAKKRISEYNSHLETGKPVLDGLQRDVENIRRIMKDMVKHGIKLSSL